VGEAEVPEKFNDQTGKLQIRVFRVHKTFGAKKAHFAGMTEVNLQDFIRNRLKPMKLQQKVLRISRCAASASARSACCHPKNAGRAKQHMHAVISGS
jgi:hypothetical protein